MSLWPPASFIFLLVDRRDAPFPVPEQQKHSVQEVNWARGPPPLPSKGTYNEFRHLWSVGHSFKVYGFI